MKTRPRLVQWGWVMLAAALLVAAGFLLRPLDTQSQSLELIDKGDTLTKEHPEMSLMTILPGGLRAPIVTYYWIRSQDLMQNGRYFEARDLASVICRLQPHAPGVWDFQGYNMAWNISVATHTPQERWKWIYNGVTLIRDEGIPLNPRNPGLYRQLGWIFFAKMGGDLDDQHQYYKARWASVMQHLLGAPPAGNIDEVIKAFEPIANPDFIDVNSPGRSGQLIQKDRLAALLKDPAVANYVSRLEAADISIEPSVAPKEALGQSPMLSLLDAYNRFSNDEAAASVRQFMPPPENDRQLAQAKLINDPSAAPARNKILAFVRAQILWNEYKMDPQFMLGLMKRYKVPLDWRIPQTVGIYWMCYGIKACGTENSEEVNDINMDRIVLGCLKDMTWYGLLTYDENPNDPDWPQVFHNTDQRYVLPTHEAFVSFIKATTQSANYQEGDNSFSSGHQNYLEGAILTILLPGHRKQEAQRLYDYIKTVYKPMDKMWESISVDDFARQEMTRVDMKDPIPQIANAQISMALQTAFVALAANQTETFKESYDYAKSAYDRSQAAAADRNRLAPFPECCASVLKRVFVAPRGMGFDLPLMPDPKHPERGDRVNLYAQLLSLNPELLAMSYDTIARPLQSQCYASGIRFDKAFPAPPGLDSWRRQMQERLKPADK